MGDLGNQDEMEAELIKRNREIAKVRDDLLKSERRLEESKMRNDDLLEKVSELDTEVTKKTTKITDLEEQVETLTTQMEDKSSEFKDLRKEHADNIENLRKDLEEKAASAQQDTAAQDELNKKFEELEVEKEQLVKDLAKERDAHQQAKNTLEAAESSNRDTSGRLVEQRRKQKELEDALAEMEDKTGNMTKDMAERMQEDQAKASAEIQKLTMQMEEHRCVRDDLEEQVREHAGELDGKRVALEDALRDLDDHRDARTSLEAARDEAESKLSEQQAGNKDELQAERMRMQEHLQKATNQASDLDGRLNAQRLILDDVRDALQGSEQTEERLASEMAQKEREYEKERDALKAVLEEEKEKASQDAKASKERHLAELQSEEVAARHHARSEIDAAELAAREAGDQNRKNEAELSQLRMHHEEAQQQHSRLQDSTKNQSSDLKQRLRDGEEKHTSLENEVDQLKKNVEEKTMEIERNTMSHKLECERLQQTLEAELGARNAAEKIAQSKLEEKDTLIENRVASIEHLEHDLQESKKKTALLEEQVEKSKEENETKVTQLGLRNAQVEGELRLKQNSLTEVEGRLEAQRLYLEQVTDTLNQAKSETNMLQGDKSSLEAQLRLEVSHKDAMNKSLQKEQDESERHCKELEERILRDRESHKDQIDEVRRSIGDELKQGAERLAAVEAELLTARQRCELLARNKADLLQEVAEHNSKASGVEGTIAEHRNKCETLGLELEQVRASKESLESDLKTLREEKRQGEHRIEELTNEVTAKEEAKASQADDFKLKVQRLDDLLTSERNNREQGERALGNARQDGESLLQDAQGVRRKLEQDLLEAKTDCESWRDKAEDSIVKLQSNKEQLEAQKTRADEVDTQRREVESQLRGDLATAEARLRRLEQESQRATSAAEEQAGELREAIKGMLRANKQLQVDNVDLVNLLKRQRAETARKALEGATTTAADQLDRSATLSETAATTAMQAHDGMAMKENEGQSAGELIVAKSPSFDNITTQAPHRAALKEVNGLIRHR